MADSMLAYAAVLMLNFADEHCDDNFRLLAIEDGMKSMALIARLRDRRASLCNETATKLMWLCAVVRLKLVALMK